MTGQSAVMQRVVPEAGLWRTGDTILAHAIVVAARLTVVLLNTRVRITRDSASRMKLASLRRKTFEKIVLWLDPIAVGVAALSFWGSDAHAGP
jgi:hypothetical protein